MSKENRIRVLKVAPMSKPEVVELDNDLDSLQKAVSIGAGYQGLIELISLEAGVDLLCNEEGKLIPLQLNRQVGMDIIAGVFYVVGSDDEGNLCSLTEEKLSKYSDRFSEPEDYANIGIGGLIHIGFVEL